jgi:hypothetical protein
MQTSYGRHDHRGRHRYSSRLCARQHGRDHRVLVGRIGDRMVHRSARQHRREQRGRVTYRAAILRWPAGGRDLGAPALALLHYRRMSLRADKYRQKAAVAKQRAVEAKNPFTKRAFEEVQAGLRRLAEQMEWIDTQKATPQRKNQLKSGPRGGSPRAE